MEITSNKLCVEPLSAKTLEQACKEAGLLSFCAPDVLILLQRYLDLLMKWNKVMNLVGTRDWRSTLYTLIADSAYLADFIKTLDISEDAQCWDLGAGAGLPGIPLRMLWKKGTYTLVEAREKRALFLRTVLSAISLPSTEVYQGRAETFMRQRPLANLVVSRAFMPFEKVLELIDAHVAPNGVCIFLTLAPAPESAIHDNWNFCGQKHYVAESDQRYLWCLQKTVVCGDQS